MKKLLLYILIIAVIAYAISYFLKIQNTKNTENVINNAVATEATSSTPQTYNISIANYAFEKNTLTINKGDTIVWKNDDSVPHQIQGDELTDLKSPIMGNGLTYSFTFNNVGTFNYYCTIHPMMKANIIVK